MTQQGATPRVRMPRLSKNARVPRRTWSREGHTAQLQITRPRQKREPPFVTPVYHSSPLFACVPTIVAKLYRVAVLET